jgi:hypothetical protein
MEIKKSQGVTETEKLLSELCENTFLKLWSFPNPFKADGKELRSHDCFGSYNYMVEMNVNSP